MNNDRLLYGVVGLVLGILTAWGLASNGMMGMRSGFNMMGNNLDQHFIDQMIPHHEDAITMANLALQKAEHQEIKQLSENIKKSQSAEIEQMEKWYEEWFGQEISLVPIAFAHGNISGMMQKGMMGDGTDLERLENAQPFDKAFIEEMIPHHQMAVIMAQMLESATRREEMKQLAHDIIEAQNSEIEQMRSWYKTWYK